MDSALKNKSENQNQKCTVVAVVHFAVGVHVAVTLAFILDLIQNQDLKFKFLVEKHVKFMILKRILMV